MLQIFANNLDTLLVKLVSENVKSESVSLVQNFIDKEIVLLVRVREGDDLVARFINMSKVIIAILDLFFR